MADLDAMTATAIASGREDEVDDGFPGYVRHDAGGLFVDPARARRRTG